MRALSIPHMENFRDLQESTRGEPTQMERGGRCPRGSNVQVVFPGGTRKNSLT